MKKILIATFVMSLTLTVPAFAADTYTGSLLESVQKKIDNTAAPIVNKERQIKAQQQALNPQNKVLDAQKQQQDLVNKKKQQIQAQKDAFNKEKEDLKSIFTIK